MDFECQSRECAVECSIMLLLYCGHSSKFIVRKVNVYCSDSNLFGFITANITVISVATYNINDNTTPFVYLE